MEEEHNAHIKRQILREEVKNYLTDMIMRDEYKPNQRLVETQIAKSLGVSQVPVREAFRDLEYMGLLRTTPYKGAYIREFSVKDVKDGYDVRAELEGLAIRTAIPIMTDHSVAELEDIYNEMLEAAAQGNLQREIALDIDFHGTIVKASQNHILQEIWQTVSIANWTYFGGYKNKSNRVELIKRHLPILEAVRKKDPELGHTVMRNHFLELKRMIQE